MFWRLTFFVNLLHLRLERAKHIAQKIVVLSDLELRFAELAIVPGECGVELGFGCQSFAVSPREFKEFQWVHFTENIRKPFDGQSEIVPVDDVHHFSGEPLFFESLDKARDVVSNERREALADGRAQFDDELIRLLGRCGRDNVFVRLSVAIF